MRSNAYSPSQPHREGILLIELVDRVGVAIGDLAFAGRPNLPKSDARADARPNQDQHGTAALQECGAGIVLQLRAGILEVLDLCPIGHAPEGRSRLGMDKAPWESRAQSPAANTTSTARATSPTPTPVQSGFVLRLIIPAG
jgi:hypothetical protein